MIKIKRLSLSLGKKSLLENGDLTLFTGDKVGIIGRNGSGKTSFFRLLLGELHEDQGEVIVSSRRISYLEQILPRGDQLALEYVQSGDQVLFPLHKKLEQALKEQNTELMAQLHYQLYNLNGYSLEARATKIMAGLGFSEEQMLAELDTFSGGWKRRLNLAKVLASNGETLLLDEPTNHLDLDTIIWLTNWLKAYSGTLLIISHDRDFLDQVVNKIILLQNRKFTVYSGNYSTYEKLKATQLQEARKSYSLQQKKINDLSVWIERFRYKATKAKQVQSRIKFLEKMKLVEITRDDSPFNFTLFPPPPAGNPLIRTTNLAVGYGEKKILEEINFSISEDESIGILGKNGLGKSTFIKTLIGLLPPLRGEIILHSKIKLGYFDQQELDCLAPTITPLTYLRKEGPPATEAEIRNFLGGFGFIGDQVFENINSYSGGEKARLVLARLIWQRPNLLILDEPTNHLDLEMRESLAYALQQYTGALILVAHDRYLLQATVDRFYWIKESRLSNFPGNLEDYYRLLGK